MNQLRSAIFGPSQGESPTAAQPIAQTAPQQPDERDSAARGKEERTADMATATEQTPATAGDVGAEGQAPAKTAIACPDPSVHQEQHERARLQDQASKAALYVTHPEKDTGTRDGAPSASDGKLSSASAATSLKHANPKTLPGFPSTGGLSTAHSHSAANLANTNQKTIEHWKPGTSQSAGKAALIAHDNQKPTEHWRPDASTAGSKAAIQAHKEGAKVNVWSPDASKSGFSAANIAVAKMGLAPKAYEGTSADEKRKALMAATGAVATDRSRRRANSTPSQPEARHGTTVAMRKPETVDANRWDSDAMQAARIQHLHMTKQMYTEHPPVEQFDREEQRHQAALKASAISMAKKMYEMQQSRIEEAAGVGAARAHAKSASSQAGGSGGSGGTALTPENLRVAAMQHLTLQEAAQRLAEERLAKMKTDDAAAFRDYYGYGSSPPRSPRQLRTRLSMKGRRRASSEGASDRQLRGTSDRWADSDDEEQSHKIRKQMNVFRNSVADVDVKKMQKDRAALIAAAEKKVHAQMHDLDKRVFDDTGKMSPAMVEEFENKARVRLEKQREEEALQKQATGEGTRKPEKINIGGGKFMDQSEIEEIARQRVRPTLLEIGEQAEKQRAKDKEMELEKEEKRRLDRISKERESEKKEDEKKAKAEEKHASKAEKDAEKAKKKEEKRVEKEEKRAEKEEKKAEKEEKRKSGKLALFTSIRHHHQDAADDDDDNVETRDTAKPEQHPPPAAPVPATSTEPETTPAPQAQSMAAVEQTTTNTTAASDAAKPKTSVDTKGSTQSPVSPPGSPTKSERDRGIKGFLSKFKRSKKSAPGEIKSFAGGHRLSRARREQEDADKDSSDAITASNTEKNAAAPASPRSPSISSLSSTDLEEEAEDRPRGRLRIDPTDAESGKEADKREPVSAIASDDFEEAKDHFGEGLAPPQPAFTSKKAGSDSSPHRDSKFFEGL